MIARNPCTGVHAVETFRPILGSDPITLFLRYNSLGVRPPVRASGFPTVA